MGRVIRGQRKGAGSVFTARSRNKVGGVKLRVLDHSERRGYVKGVVKALVHDPGRGAPVAKVEFRHPYKFKKETINMVATEGMYTGQFVYAGAKANLKIGNILPVGRLPEGTIVCNVEQRPGDRGKISRASGD